MLDGIWSFCRSFGLIDNLSDDISLFYFAPGFSMQWSVYAIIYFFSFLSATPISKTQPFCELSSGSFIPLLHSLSILLVNVQAMEKPKGIKHSDGVAACLGTFHPTHADYCTEKCFVVEISSKPSEPNIRACQNLEKKGQKFKWIKVYFFCTNGCFLHSCCHAASFIQKIATHFFLSETPEVLMQAGGKQTFSKKHTPDWYRSSHLTFR